MEPSPPDHITAEAARLLSEQGVAAQASGDTLHCQDVGGMQVLLRTRWQSDPSFAREQVLRSLASALLQAELRDGPNETGKPG